MSKTADDELNKRIKKRVKKFNNLSVNVIHIAFFTIVLVYLTQCKW